ncbi:heat shock 70 kDa protein BIP5-like [Oryza glaberrima]|uniref:heat shock 70 kDa protein BIP5-like n=1 Tax=Oryza glaberrima TaxID=4538 RepID=UPI00224C0ABB|nr:heat shock 70 kDa protein BIP5-like [Oryza glaberrima]
MATAAATAATLLLAVSGLASGLVVPADERCHSTDNAVLGIDIGATYSCVAVYCKGRVEIIPNDQGNRLTPSWVAEGGGRLVVGEAAKEQAAGSPGRAVVHDFMRLLGKKFGDDDVQREMTRLPYAVVDMEGKPHVRVEAADGDVRVLSPEEIAAAVLAKMKETAEAHLGRTVSSAVVAVPVYFNDAQRRAISDAGGIAGLDVMRIVSEPIAAAVAYGLDNAKSDGKRVVVFDLGGETLDVTALVADNGFFDVLATNGDGHLGGEGFDQRVVNHFVDLIKRKHGRDISGDGRAMHRLRRECERAKHALSAQHQVRVEIEALLDGGVDLSETLTRAQFEELNDDLFARTMAPLRKTMADAGLEKGDIDEIIPVGGSTRIPKVQQLIRDYFDGKKEIVKVNNPDETVAYGAAVIGRHVAGDDDDKPTMLDLPSFLSDTISIETAGGAVTPMIPRRSRLPAERTHVFTTYLGRQTAVAINVFQGEGSTAKDNTLLGRLELTGIPPASVWNWGWRWRPIQVTVKVDELGDIHVEAADEGSGKSERLSIVSGEGHEHGRLSKEEIDRMIREVAEDLVEEERIVKERVDALNMLETYIVKNTAVTGGETDCEAKARAASEWLDGNPAAEKEDYEEKLKELEDACGPFMAAVHETSGLGHDEL